MGNALEKRITYPTSVLREFAIFSADELNGDLISYFSIDNSTEDGV